MIMVRSKEELIAKLRTFGETDDVVEMIEDISDTLDAKEATEDSENWKERYEELDRTWRKKYLDRFSEGSKDSGIEEEEEEEEEKTTYEDLFKEEKVNA